MATKKVTKTITKPVKVVKAPEETFNQKKLIDTLIGNGLDYNDIGTELGVSKSAVYGWHKETSTMPLVARKYFDLRFGSADNMIYERQLNNLRTLLLKLKKHSKGESDVKDIVQAVFG